MLTVIFELFFCNVSQLICVIIFFYISIKQDGTCRDNHLSPLMCEVCAYRYLSYSVLQYIQIYHQVNMQCNMHSIQWSWGGMNEIEDVGSYLR